MGLGDFRRRDCGRHRLRPGWRPRYVQHNTAQTGQTPVDILKARLARGEIGREEYEEKLRDLES